MPYLPASFMPEGLIVDAAAIGIRSCSGRIWSCASKSSNQSLFTLKRSSPSSSRMITPSASSWRSRSSTWSMPNVRASDGSAPGPVPRITRPPVMWSSCTMRCATLNGWWYGQRHDAGAELDVLGALARRGQEQLRRRDHLPARRVVLAAPELVVAEPIEVLDEVEVALQLQARVLADGMMGREKGTELETVHGGLPSMSTAVFTGVFQNTRSTSRRSIGALSVGSPCSAARSMRRISGPIRSSGVERYDSPPSSRIRRVCSRRISTS